MSPREQEALVRAIHTQRLRLFQLGVMLACMGLALDDVYVPGHEHDAADLETLTKATVKALDEIAAALDPAALGLTGAAGAAEDLLASDLARAAARNEMRSLRELAKELTGGDQEQLRARVVAAADLIEQLIAKPSENRHA